MRCIVLGAGRQGLAIAYDLGRHGGAESITLVDAAPGAAKHGATRLRRMLDGVRIRPIERRLGGRDAVAHLRGHDVAVSALPYRLNLALTKAAVAARVSFCDLGGNTGIVEQQLELAGRARAAGITLLPDCGLAPGLANVLAAIAIEQTPRARDVRIWCGGLPVEPRGPLGYSLLFSMEGLTNEYRGESVVLRKGRVRRVEAFTECEPFAGPRQLGALEAFHTSGGASTAPWTFRKQLRTYEYKTIRYAGHFAKVRAMIDLGLLDEEPVVVSGRSVAPRAVFHAAAGAHLDHGTVRDLAFLRVDCTDARGKGVRYQMLQHFDEDTGFSAMEQTTGYPTALAAAALATGEVEPGALTPERAGFADDHLRALRRRGLRIRRSKI